MDELLPHMQFVVSLSDRACCRFPFQLRKKRLEIHRGETQQPPKRKSVRLPPGTILLIDVDGRLPNFALMKLSRYYQVYSDGATISWSSWAKSRQVRDACWTNAGFSGGFPRTRFLRLHFGSWIVFRFLSSQRVFLVCHHLFSWICLFDVFVFFLGHLSLLA